MKFPAQNQAEIDIRSHLARSLRSAVIRTFPEAALELAPIAIHARPRPDRHGDFSTNIAFLLAQKMRLSASETATTIMSAYEWNSSFVEPPEQRNSPCTSSYISFRMSSTYLKAMLFYLAGQDYSDLRQAGTNIPNLVADVIERCHKLLARAHANFGKTGIEPAQISLHVMGSCELEHTRLLGQSPWSFSEIAPLQCRFYATKIAHSFNWFFRKYPVFVPQEELTAARILLVAATVNALDFLTHSA